jgi:hypothetical protein
MSWKNHAPYSLGLERVANAEGPYRQPADEVFERAWRSVPHLLRRLASDSSKLALHRLAFPPLSHKRPVNGRYPNSTGVPTIPDYDLRRPCH